LIQKKEEIKDHIVIPDTNILWFKDKSVVVNPEFDSFWKRYQNDSKLDLVIPEVVMGEILFQQSTSAIKLMNKAATNIKEISSITNFDYSHRITASKIKSQIKKRLNKWAKAHKSTVIATPITKINWVEIIQNSIWRTPPFESDAKNPTNEKGFRDALILETVTEYCHSNTDDCQIAFICNDHLLRKTTAKKLKGEERFSVYESIDDFESYLKLQHEELTDKFIKSILQRASRKFFQLNNTNCLFAKEKIRQRIIAKYERYIEIPKLSEESGSALGLLHLDKWEPASGGKYLVGNAQFVEIEDKNIYHWSTIVTYVRQYESKPLGVLSFGASLSNDHLLILPFHISWEAKVTIDAKFRSTSISNIEMKKNQFIELTDDLRRRYAL